MVTGKPQRRKATRAGGQGAGAEGAVETVLRERSDTTATELAEATGLGRSTVNRALAALERHGRAAREPGGRDGSRRLGDRWHAVGGDQTEASERLGRGALRTAVEAYCAAHPGEALTASRVARELGRSAGAVANALVALAEQGVLREVGSEPRRYEANPA